MRLYEISNNSVDRLKRECKPFLEMINYRKSLVPFRGSHKNISELTYVPIRKDRSPMDIPTVVHNALNVALRDAGFKARRDNSLFVSGSYSFASNYGGVYRVIPTGEFNFTWSPEVDDMIEHYRRLAREGYMTQVFSDDVFYGENFTVKANDFIASLPIPHRSRWNGEEDSYQIRDDGLTDYLKENYKSTDWLDAIGSGNEIYLQAEGAYWMPHTLFEALELEA